MGTGGLDKILVDTSAWIEFFRKKEPYYSLILKLTDNDTICCTGLVLAELLQGSKTEKELSTIKEFLYIFDFLPETLELWEKAGEVSYNLRRKGRSAGLSDCYIAVHAIAHNVRLLTLDRHFSVLGKETGLRLYTV